MKIVFPSVRFVTASIGSLLVLTTYAAELGTRERTICPVSLGTNPVHVVASNVNLYAEYGYSAWQWGEGVDDGQRHDLMPEGYPSVTNAAQLLSFFAFADVHMTDEESPAQVPFMGWTAPYRDSGQANLNPSAYSAVVLATTQRLNATVKTVNKTHQLTPFDFGIVLGDVCNSGQYNELRWFIDVMDGQWIDPDSGAPETEPKMDYQQAFQAEGLNSSIPWYQVPGNHDLMWMGIGYPSEKTVIALTNNVVMERSSIYNPLVCGAEGSGQYVGVIDGSTEFGDVVKYGPTNEFDTPPPVAADPNRHMMDTDLTWSKNYITEFTHSVSQPFGHGFDLAQSNSLAGCYSYKPASDIPIKVVVLDNTCKLAEQGKFASFYGAGWVDAPRFTWLTNELAQAQTDNELVILACHIPIKPYKSLTNAVPQNTFYIVDGPQELTNGWKTIYQTPSEYPGCKTDDEMIAMLHTYPNVMMVTAGHRHMNVITPFPATEGQPVENGFWEVECPSLRDFPQQFRTYEILRNTDHTISIKVTSVDPEHEAGSPSEKSLGYAIATRRVYGPDAPTDESSKNANGELVVALTPAMQSIIAGVGRPLGHRVAIDQTDSGGDVRFLGTLYSTTNLMTGSWNYLTNGSPCTVDNTSRAVFYRAYE
ncbi:MAG: TIGR03768 family metallophosphoesterase [Halothiobacillus sp.]|jgi:metallophosphoesterase (TIGR03768 family)|nr:TIGR03768 family metallophosphoesterase [Halothiobacillus sp.]